MNVSVQESVAYWPKAEDNLGMAVVAAKRFCSRKFPVVDSEEYADACVGLIKAERSFIPEMGPDCWPTWAWRHMRNAIIDGYRARQDGLASLNRSSNTDQITDREPPFLPDAEILLRELLKPGPNDTDEDVFSRDLLVLHYVRGERVRDLAKKFQVSREAVYQRIRRAILKIQANHPEIISEWAVQ